MTPEERKAYFIDQLHIGDNWAEYVANRITAAGKFAEATPTKIAQSEEEIREFTENEKDILLSRGRTLEVKSRSFAFNDITDYPFDTVFVDTVEGWQAKAQLPVAVVSVSQRSGGMVVVPVSTVAQWGRRRVFDSKRGFEVEVFECPKGLLRSFEEFVAWL